MIWLAILLMGILVSSLAAMCIDVWDRCRELEEEWRLDGLWGDEDEDWPSVTLAEIEGLPEVVA